MEKGNLLFYTMFHPFHGFEEIKQKKSGSTLISMIILAAWFITMIFTRQLTGFIFNPYRVDKLNIFSLLPGTIILFTIWAISNWGFCTLLDGEGTFHEVWIVSAYALVPYIICSLIYVFCSNFFTLEAATFLLWIYKAGKYWSIILIFLGLAEMHQYTFKKTLWSIFLTIVGIFIILFLGFLLFSLFNQVATFFMTIYNEITTRL